MKQYFKDWLSIWNTISISSLPPLPNPKIFKPKYDLPKLDNYRVAPPASFWNAFPSNKMWPGKSLVCGAKLYELASDCPGLDQNLLKVICKDIKHGAKIGCTGSFRNAGKATNAPSAYKDGDKVSDAICDWVVKKFAFGPVNMEELPENAKINGIMTRPKPNGSVRIILNLSSPKGSAVNDGIDSNEFPTSMSSTTLWLEALNKAGHRCKIMKCDWQDAYKHLAVHCADLPLQWFSWLGKAFCELCLVFGGKSSAGLFDRLAKVVLEIIIQRAGIDRTLVIQHLDDICAAAPENSTVLERFDSECFNVAELLGVRLAPRDDPSKSFAPTYAGVVLGIHYDTHSWTWGLPEEKLLRLLHDLKRLISSDTLEQDVIWSIVGKIINVRPLVPGGRYNIYHLILANSFSTDSKSKVPIDGDLKRQAWFWFSALQVCSGRASIPNPSLDLPPWTIDIYTDAAGGSWRSVGQGVGAVAKRFWVVLPWGRAINAGHPTTDGRKLDRIMSALELFGPLLALCAGHSIFRGKSLRFWVDNAGSVFIFKKGYSTSCRYSTAIVSALAAVAAGLGCSIAMEKITRCSNPGAVMADTLSKGDTKRFWDLALQEEGLDLPIEPAVVPKTLVWWASHPTPDFDLGEKLLRELSAKETILGYSA